VAKQMLGIFGIFLWKPNSYTIYRQIPTTRQTKSQIPANLPNRYSALCWKPVMHAQTYGPVIVHCTDSEDFPGVTCRALVSQRAIAW